MTTATRPGKPKRRRALAPSFVLALSTAALAFAVTGTAALGAHGQYGRLIAEGKLDAAGTPKASFHGVRPASVFWLVVTNPADGQLAVSWSVSCSNPAHKASGGATGEATIARGRWVKRVRAGWIKHPSYCSGRVEGLTGSSPLKIRLYAE